jgi:hypothetical protein
LFGRELFESIRDRCPGEIRLQQHWARHRRFGRTKSRSGKRQSINERKLLDENVWMYIVFLVLSGMFTACLLEEDSKRFYGSRIWMTTNCQFE